MMSAPSFFASSAVARPITEDPPTTTTFLPASVIAFPSTVELAVLVRAHLRRLHDVPAAALLTDLGYRKQILWL
jgi:hypothetical protein